MKDILVGVLAILLIVNTIFIMCCAKISSEVENGKYDNKPSKNRKRKANK